MFVAARRVVQYAPATITWQPTDQDGELVAAVGTPTVTVTRADGTAIAITPTLTSGVVSLPLTSVHTASLDNLAIVWLLNAEVRGTSTVDVVAAGGLTVAECRDVQSGLGGETTNATVKVRAAIDVVTSLVESACGRAFSPRFDVARLTAVGSRDLRLPHPNLRRVRWAYTTVDLIRTDAVTIDLDEIVADEAGIARGYWWWRGAKVTVGYEHGYDRPPADLRRAMVLEVRRQVNAPKGGLDPRAMSYSPPEGGNVVLATPGLGSWITGIPGIDEVLNRHRVHFVNVA